MKANRMCVTLGILVWLAVAQTASGFYNPESGRWLSRDPIEEQGGPSLYGYSQNDPIAQFDPQGTSIWSRNLVYESEGQAQRDPPLPLATFISWDSGRQASPNAWTWQMVFGFGLNEGGICNTGIRYPGHAGTFAQGSVGLRCATPAMVTIRCTVVYVVVAVASEPTSISAALGGISKSRVNFESTMLGDVLPRHHKYVPNGTVLVLAAVETRTKTLFLNPFQKHELYNINPWIGGIRETMGFFIEHLIVYCEELEDE